MNVIMLETGRLNPYANNPRRNDGAVDAVANSIKEFGFKVPVIIDKNNEIVAGHTRVKAAKKLGLPEIPCIVADDLTDEQIKAFRLADNKTHELAEWDFDLLNVELDGIFDIDMADFGFDLCDDTETAEPHEDEFDVEANMPDEPVAKPGDIYQLGRHRLMCGDCTDSQQLQNLISDNTFDMMFTDPPYKMNIGGKGCFTSSMKNAKNRIKDIINFNPYVISFFNELDCGSFYICTSKDGVPDYLDIFRNFNFNILVWCKTNPTPFTSGTFLPDIEYILYFSNKNKIWNNSIKPSDVYKKYYISSKESGRKEDGDLHPTMKPLEMVRNRLKISSNENGKVLDLFGGSGSTLIACEQLNRVCFMMELDPKYVDVIIKRWENLTGSKAVKIN